MPEVRFYHLTTSTAKQAVPKLLSKTLLRGKRALVKLPEEEAVHTWNEHLWAYEADSFLPHGSIKDPDPDTQPIFLTHADENPGRAEYLFLIEGADRQDLEGFEMTAVLFEGADEAAVGWARGRWRQLRETALELSYWQQDEKGHWANKG